MPILGIPRLPSVSTPPPLPAPTASKRYNPWAIASISLAASTVIGSWCLGGLAAVITGHIARHQIKQTGEAGGSLALAGLIAGYAAIALTLAFITLYILFFVFVFALAFTHPGATPSPTPG
jgi:Domain of unknown function (DUF4190)